MRKLATIRRIKELRHIINADVIELATIDGWQVVVKRGEFAVGDLCVYFEIDSFLPICSKYEFLRKSSYRKMGNEEGFRLRTVKLRKQISQGLALPLSVFNDEPLLSTWELGSDVTEQLEVKKWDPPLPACLGGYVRGTFPSWIQKTDQERIQNLWDTYSVQYHDEEFEATIKLDGISMTVYFNKELGEYGVCQRNLDMKETENNTMWKVAHQMGLIERLVTYDRSIAIQGELVGPGVNGNKEKVGNHHLFVFDIYDINNHRYFNSKDRLRIISDLGLSVGDVHTPILETFKPFQRFSSIDQLLEYAQGPSIYALQREGVVFKQITCDPSMSPISFKAISNKFLLKHKE